MIEAFHHITLLDTSTANSGNDATTLLGIAVLSGFGILSAVLLTNSLHHKSEETSNPFYWPKLLEKPRHRPERIINPGNFSSWEKFRARMPRGSKLN